MRLIPTTPLEVLVDRLLSAAEGYIDEQQSFHNCKTAYYNFCKFLGVDEKSGRYNINSRTTAQIKTYLTQKDGEFVITALKDEGAFTTVRFPGYLSKVITRWEASSKPTPNNSEIEKLRAENEALKKQLANSTQLDQKQLAETVANAVATATGAAVTAAAARADDKLDTISMGSRRSKMSTTTGKYETVVNNLCGERRAMILFAIIDAYDQLPEPNENNDKETNVKLENNKNALRQLHDDILLHSCVLTKRKISSEQIINMWKESDKVKNNIEVIAQVEKIVAQAPKDKPPRALSESEILKDVDFIRHGLKKSKKDDLLIPSFSLAETIKTQNAQKAQKAPVQIGFGTVKGVAVHSGSSSKSSSRRPSDADPAAAAAATAGTGSMVFAVPAARPPKHRGDAKVVVNGNDTTQLNGAAIVAFNSSALVLSDAKSTAPVLPSPIGGVGAHIANNGTAAVPAATAAPVLQS